MNGLASSSQAVPAMSRCTQGVGVGELLQEHGGGDGAAPAPADVRHVGEGALEVLLVVVVERHAATSSRPRPGRHPARAPAARRRCRTAPTLTWPSATTMAPVRVAASTRWVQPRLARVGEGVGQDQPAFGVGVEHLDGLARERRHDVAGPLRAAAGHVLDGGNQRRHRHGRLQLRDGPHGADHGGAARHVVLHLLHAVGGLDGDAAGIERDALAHQAQVHRLAVARARRAGSAGRSAPAARRCPAPRRAARPCPAARMRSRSSTSHSRPNSAAIARARSASTVGVRRLAGSLTSSRAKFCASATMRPRSQRGVELRPPPATTVNRSTALLPFFSVL